MSTGIHPIKHPLSRNLAAVLVVTGVGFLLLNLTFLLDFAFHSAVIALIRLVAPADPAMGWRWFAPAMHGLFAVGIGLIAWFVLRSRLGVLAKATFLAVPFAVVFVTLGIFFYRWPVLVYGFSIAFAGGVAAYLYRTRQPWLYAYALALVGLSLLIGALLGLEI